MRKTVSFSRNAVNVFFHILTRCNLSCRHCYINPDQHGTRRLPIEVVNTWLAAFVRPDRSSNLIFLGGEPTLHPDLAPAVRTARKLGYASITIDTNGYLFHDILDRVTPDEVDFFSFSLDGPDAAANDALRGKGAFDHGIAGIQKAAAKGFQTSLIYTVSSANIDRLAEMPPLLQKLGVKRFFIQVLGLRGNVAGEERTIRQVSRDTWRKIIPAVADAVAHAGITVTYPKVYLDRGERFECAGQVAENYFIFPNGRVYRCPLCEDYPLHSLEMKNSRPVPRAGLTEARLFELGIPEGCVMNRLIQPENLAYTRSGAPAYRIACCMLKEEILAHTGR